MKPFHFTPHTFHILVLLCLFVSACTTSPLALIDSTPPEIDLWYGTQQVVDNGDAQQWINILGNAWDDRTGITALHYTLNGAAEKSPLTVGPTDRRLVNRGDFNIELDKDTLRDGENQVTISVTNSVGLRSEVTVNLFYDADPVWPLPYQVDWSSVQTVGDAVQVVDGKWQLTPQGIRTEQVGYDRVLAIGDLDWTDYEVTTMIQVHGVDANAYGHKISTNHGLGINLRWTGHTNDPKVCPQRRCGWHPTGGSTWYEYRKNMPGLLKLAGGPPNGEEVLEYELEMDQVYWWKARVETLASGSRYLFKVWPEGSAEPDGWLLARQTESGNLKHGSLLLVAHHVDVTFGDIEVQKVE